MDPSPVDMRGEWQGDARLVVAWARPDPVRVAIHVGDDGRVTGRVGGATLRNGYLSLNRGDFARWLDIKTDYIVRGDLEGKVHPYQSVASKIVFIPVNHSAGRLEGGVTTCQSDHGGGKDIALAGTLSLRHP